MNIKKKQQLEQRLADLKNQLSAKAGSVRNKGYTEEQIIQHFDEVGRLKMELEAIEWALLDIQERIEHKRASVNLQAKWASFGGTAESKSALEYLVAMFDAIELAEGKNEVFPARVFEITEILKQEFLSAQLTKISPLFIESHIKLTEWLSQNDDQKYSDLIQTIVENSKAAIQLTKN